MNLKALISIGLCIATLTACKPDLRTIGTVDDDKLITPAMIDEMGFEEFEEFEKRYVGKEVTFKDFYSSRFMGGYHPQKGQCEFSLHNYDKKNNKEIAIYIYANHWPDFVIEDLLKRAKKPFAQYLNYPEETDLPMDVCEERCEYNEKTGACFYKSPNLKITGKPFLITEGTYYYIYMKLKGVEY